MCYDTSTAAVQTQQVCESVARSVRVRTKPTTPPAHSHLLNSLPPTAGQAKLLAARTWAHGLRLVRKEGYFATPCSLADRPREELNMTTTELFAVEREGDTLIVIPRADLHEWDFRAIDTEARDVLRLLESDVIRNVVLDFHETDFF